MFTNISGGMCMDFEANIWEKNKFMDQKKKAAGIGAILMAFYQG